MVYFYADDIVPVNKDDGDDVDNYGVEQLSTAAVVIFIFVIVYNCSGLVGFELKQKSSIYDS